jgi:hypothetical protein
MRPAVGQPVPIRRSTTQKPALHTSLRAHRRHHPMPRPHHLPLRLRTQQHQQSLMYRTVQFDGSTRFGQPDSYTDRVKLGNYVPKLVTVERALILPTTTAPNCRSGASAAANNAAAAGRSAHDHRRDRPSSKNSTTTSPWSSTNSSATARYHARDVTGS